MGKLTRQMSFSNAEIDFDAAVIRECNKDGDVVGEFTLEDVFRAWDGVCGVSITIKQANDFNTFPVAEDGED